MRTISTQGFLFFLLLSLPINSPAEDKWRDLVENYLGEKIATTFFGEKEVVSEIPMPSIPEIKKNATSQEAFNQKEKLGNKKFSADEERKFQLNFVKEVVEATLNRLSHNEDYSKWMNVLEQGATREGVYRAMILGTKYRDFEMQEIQMNEKVLNFSREFLQKFCGRQLKDDVLKQYNFYAMKRVVVERALEIIDVFKTTSEEDLNHWYAHFGGDIATNYAVAFGDAVRKNPSKDYHLEWSKMMPEQYIKSEVIIRLHTVMNHLQFN
jgi:hypothetical protein